LNQAQLAGLARILGPAVERYLANKRANEPTPPGRQE
jgi:hypothetical protein